MKNQLGRKRNWVAILCAIISFCCGLAPAMACSRLPDKPKPIAQRDAGVRYAAQEAVAIVEILVLNDSDYGRPPNRARVIRSLKGSIKPGRILTFKHPGHSCGVNYRADQQGIVLLSDTNGQYQTQRFVEEARLGLTAPVTAQDKADPDTVATTKAEPAARVEWRDFLGDMQLGSIPKAVRAFVIDGQACTHFSGEEGYDKARAAYLAKMTKKHCRNLDARKAALELKYSANFDALVLMEDAWETAPMVLDPNDPNIPPPPVQRAATQLSYINPDPGPKFTLGNALYATTGKWTGSLEYRDYQSNQWFGLPVNVTIQAQPDGATTVRTSEYDDGPQTGLVWITTVQQVDEAAKLLSYAIFRKGRAADNGAMKIAQFGGDRSRWAMVVEERRKDGDGFAMVRETTTYDTDGVVAKMTTLKEVDPEGDGKDEFQPRNRTVLTLVK